MRRFVAIVLCFLTISFLTWSQNVSINITIEKDSNVISFQPTETDYCPRRLKITYENRTDSAIYFEKVMKDIQLCKGIGLPLFRSPILSNPPISKYSSYDYSTDTTVIAIPLGPNETWTSFSDSTFSSSSRKFVLDKDLELYYDSLYFNSFQYQSFQSQDEFIFQAHSLGRYKDLVNDFTSHRIDSLSKYTDFFVFLGPGETYSDYYDISGFEYFKGHYFFMITRNYWPNSIVIEERYSEVLKRGIQLTVRFPDSAGIYKLYTGPIVSNVLSITF